MKTKKGHAGKVRTHVLQIGPTAPPQDPIDELAQTLREDPVRFLYAKVILETYYESVSSKSCAKPRLQLVR